MIRRSECTNQEAPRKAVTLVMAAHLLLAALAGVASAQPATLPDNAWKQRNRQTLSSAGWR